MDYETRDRPTLRTDPIIALFAGAGAATFVAFEGITLQSLGWISLSLIHLLSFEWGRNPDRYPDTITEYRHGIIAIMFLIPLGLFVTDLILLLLGAI